MAEVLTRAVPKTVAEVETWLAAAAAESLERPAAEEATQRSIWIRFCTCRILERDLASASRHLAPVRGGRACDLAF